MSDLIPKRTIFLIRCSTGCSCCWGENHWRGPYKTKADADRRVASFRAPDSKFWPVASQYSRRGNYTVREVEMELLPDGRAIVDSEVLDEVAEFIEVADDGSVADNKAERFDLECY